MPRHLVPGLRGILLTSFAFLVLSLGVGFRADSCLLESFAQPPGSPPDASVRSLALAKPMPLAMKPQGLKKLSKKYAKRLNRLESAQVNWTAAQSAHLAAAFDLEELLAEIPAPTPKQIKKAHHALKKAAKSESKAVARLEKALKKFDAVVDKILAIDPGYFDEPPVPTRDELQVSLLVQEALPAHVPGVERAPGVATFGVPFAQADAVPEIAGRPALGVAGAEVWQFRTLDTWPDGSVRWALCDVEVALHAGQVLDELAVVSGPGESGGSPIGASSSESILLDTGPLQALIRVDGFNLFQSVTVEGKLVIPMNTLPGIVGRGVGGEVLVPGKGTKVVLEENGPARAVVRADGTLVGPSGLGYVDFTCRITARRNSSDLEASFTVRNASLERPRHAILESVELVTQIQTLGAPRLAVSGHEGPVQRLLQPSGSSAALFYQAYSAAKTSGLGGVNYLPHLPTVAGDPKSFVEEGYRLTIDGQLLHELGDETVYPGHAWMNLSSPEAGMTVGIQDMAYQWPAALEARGDGTVLVGLFPEKNPAPYTFVWRQHESRHAVFSFHAGAPLDPSLATRRLDAPLTGRVADYGYYNRSGVFPYDLLTEQEHEETLAMMGIEHAIEPNNPPLSVTRFLYKGTTGGPNNQAGIEIALAGDWLRNGTGGDFRNGLNLALYKSEWQIPRSDDFDHSDDPGATNEEVPHCNGHFGDDEHRYREGIVLAYFLTGDERFREALFDEAEVLVDVSIWPHERSMYQTLRALTYVAEFTRQAELEQALRTRLDYITTPVIDIHSATTGYGWEAPPGEGDRGYYVTSSANQSEKPPGEHFQARGFISASLGPLGYYHAWRGLPAGDPLAEAARGRMRDLSKWARWELYPSKPNPAEQRLSYSYAISQQQVTKWESTDFHPLLLGMAESWRDTGQAGYLEKGVEQLQAAALHGNLGIWDTRLDVQHFLSAYRDFLRIP